MSIENTRILDDENLKSEEIEDVDAKNILEVENEHQVAALKAYYEFSLLKEKGKNKTRIVLTFLANSTVWLSLIINLFN